jgi:DNA-binding response OmpR family regulator
MASILLIDDDEGLCVLMADVLRQAGHAVDVAASGEAGIALYRAKPCDLVITDIAMPGMEGFELIELLRHSKPRPRIIAMSGGSNLSQPVYLPIAKRLGAQLTLAKPVPPDVLLQAVAGVLAMPVPGPAT